MYVEDRDLQIFASLLEFGYGVYTLFLSGDSFALLLKYFLVLVTSGLSFYYFWYCKDPDTDAIGNWPL